MKILKYYISIVFIAIIALSSCEKHELKYDATIVDETKVMVQIHFFVPIQGGSDNAITQVQINDIPVTLNNLNPYNGIPNGATGKFFTTDAGNVNIKLFRGNATAGYNKIYDQSVNLEGAKFYNLVVHNFNTPPTVIDAQYPYPKYTGPIPLTPEPGSDEDIGIAFARFLNFYYDADTTPLCKNGDKLQLQYVYTTTGGGDAGWTPYAPETDTFALGEPVGFGEATEWTPVIIKKNYHNSAGYTVPRCMIRLIKADGTKQWIPYVNASNVPTVYTSVVWTPISSGTYSEIYIGRYYYKILGGISGGGVYSKQIIDIPGWTLY
jgi:hypothetical protein